MWTPTGGATQRYSYIAIQEPYKTIRALSKTQPFEVAHNVPDRQLVCVEARNLRYLLSRQLAALALPQGRKNQVYGICDGSNAGVAEMLVGIHRLEHTQLRDLRF